MDTTSPSKKMARVKNQENRTIRENNCNRCEAQPPKLQGNKLVSFENTWVAGRGMMMVMGDNLMMKASVSRNINMILIIQNTHIITPIREVEAKLGREFSRESMKGIQDKWIHGRGRAELVSEGGVNKVDKEDVRKEGDCLIIGIRGWYVVRMA